MAMRSTVVALAVTAAGLFVGLRPAAAQHATANDLKDGERAFADSCANCHGPDGNLIAGIDFGRGIMRRDYTDAELAAIIMNGIPNTPMPPSPGMSEVQAGLLVGYLRSLAAAGHDASVVGDASSGRAIFFGKGECTGCHAVDAHGARHGPDLSRIGEDLGAAQIEASLRDPGAEVRPANREIRVTLADGTVVGGRLLNHDTFSVQLIDNDDRLRSFDKAGLRDFRFVGSSMPAYGDRLTQQEIADLVRYLTTLTDPAND